MSDSADLIKLYSTQILSLAADIPHLGRLEAPQASVKKRSPLCGSTVTVDLDLTDGRVSRFGQDVKACALGQAAASVVGQSILGCTIDQLDQAYAQLENMLAKAGPIPDPPFAGFEPLLPAREYRNRHASILLSISAATEAAHLAHASQNT